MGSITSQITSPSNVYSTAHSGADQRKHQSSASLAFVQGIHRGPVNSPHKWPVTRKMFPFDDAIMIASETAMTIIYVRKTLHGSLVSTRRGIYIRESDLYPILATVALYVNRVTGPYCKDISLYTNNKSHGSSKNDNITININEAQSNHMHIIWVYFMSLWRGPHYLDSNTYI